MGWGARCLGKVKTGKRILGRKYGGGEMWDLMFSQWCQWWLLMSGMWHQLDKCQAQ
jgi:hypothetical protein